jgi:hypothetical protein
VVASEERAMTEQETIVQGVIRREEVPFLSQYGTAYVLYDEQEDTFSYPIKSDRYRFSEYVGLRAEVSGPASDVGRELAVMNVTHIQLSSDR